MHVTGFQQPAADGLARAALEGHVIGDGGGRAKILKEFFGNRQLRDITPMLIKKLKSSLLGAEAYWHTARKGSTVNRDLQLLSRIFSMAYDNGLIDSNPCRGCVRRRKEAGARDT